MLTKIISGGQTGVDRVALDVAIELKIPHSGWCPKGRIDENSSIPIKYQLTETFLDDYSERTKLNVRDSDGTLIVLTESAIGGTLLTIEEAQRLKKAYFIFNLLSVKIEDVVSWICQNQIAILNVAGPRESQSPGIYNLARANLQQLCLRLINYSSRTGFYS